jgi:hypothetical protein
MSRLVPSRLSVTLRVLAALAPLAVLVTAAIVRANGGDESALPAQPDTAPPGAAAPDAPPAAAADLQLLALRAGPGPYPWLVPGRVARSFITDTPETLELVALARVKGRPELDAQIRWEILPPAGFQVPAGAGLTGGKLALRLRRPEGNPAGGGGPLSLTVAASLPQDGKTYRRTLTLAQDLRDRLRQEYVDLERTYVPARRDLLDADQFARLYRKKYRTVEFAELNWSKQPGGEERYPVILAAEELLRTIHQTEETYGRPLVISSGFRNPVRQVEVHASVGESHHQYGRAADLYAAPDSAPPQTGRKVTSEGDWLRLAAASLRGGGVWIEPMLACNVNTAGCHVHVDVREGGPASRIVRLTGKITDPAGDPVPGATVRLAGMPTVTNAQGIYTLKHVLTPREYELQVEAPGRELVTQQINVGVSDTLASLQLPADAQPSLTARARDAGRTRNGLTVNVAVKNIGRSEARGVRLSGASDLPGGVQTVLPAHLAALAPGQEATFLVQLAANEGAQAGQIPVGLTASFRTPTGTTRTQSLLLKASVAAVPQDAPAAPKSAPRGGTAAPPAPPRPDLGAAAGGMAVGGAAAAIGAAARRKAARSNRKDAPSSAPAAPSPASEPSIDPAATPDGK